MKEVHKNQYYNLSIVSKRRVAWRLQHIHLGAEYGSISEQSQLPAPHFTPQDCEKNSQDLRPAAENFVIFVALRLSDPLAASISSGIFIGAECRICNWLYLGPQETTRREDVSYRNSHLSSGGACSRHPQSYPG